MKIAGNIKFYRKQLDLTQEQLANVSRRFLLLHIIIVEEGLGPPFNLRYYKNEGVSRRSPTDLRYY